MRKVCGSPWLSQWTHMNFLVHTRWEQEQPALVGLRLARPFMQRLTNDIRRVESTPSEE